MTFSTVLFLLMAVACSMITSPAIEPVSGERVRTPAIDRKYRIEPADFESLAQGEWISPLVQSEMLFDELVYYWNARLDWGEGFRLYLQVGFDSGEFSPWLYAGFWGKVKPYEGKRENIRFENGVLKQDWLFLDTDAESFRFKIVDEGVRALKNLPSLGIITTDNSPPPELVSASQSNNGKEDATTIVLDIPLNKQEDIHGNRMPQRCQSAALASALEYFGAKVPLENIVCYTTDPEYRSFGIWPRTINAAYEHGFDAYLDRFRDWDYVVKTLKENKVILCSIVMPADDSYIAPPYKSIGGHIVALNGVTADGRVIVTDSAAMVGDDGYCLQWLREDFEKVWMRNKGGIGMVICPPPGATPRFVEQIEPFRRKRQKSEKQ